MNRFRNSALTTWTVSAVMAWLLALVSLGDLKISEFQAKNLATLDDEQLASSDWIEIRNEGGAEVNLEGYFLTDDPENLDKWVFPGLRVGARDEKQNICIPAMPCSLKFIWAECVNLDVITLTL